MLLYTEPPRLSPEDFLLEAGRLLGAAEARTLEAARLSNFDPAACASPAFNRYREWEIGLRARLALMRAAARKEDETPYARLGGETVETARFARSAFEAPDPLQAEEILLRARWDMLSNLEVLHFFDMEFLVVYFLKLQVLARRALLSQENGRPRFDSLKIGLEREIAERVQT